MHDYINANLSTTHEAQTIERFQSYFLLLLVSRALREHEKYANIV